MGDRRSPQDSGRRRDFRGGRAFEGPPGGINGRRGGPILGGRRDRESEFQQSRPSDRKSSFVGGRQGRASFMGDLKSASFGGDLKRTSFGGDLKRTSFGGDLKRSPFIGGDLKRTSLLGDYTRSSVGVEQRRSLLKGDLKQSSSFGGQDVQREIGEERHLNDLKDTAVTTQQFGELDASRKSIKDEIFKMKNKLKTADNDTDDEFMELSEVSNIKRKADCEIEEGRPKKKKKKKKSKAKRDEFKNPDGHGHQPAVKDNLVLRKKLQEVLDENAHLKLDIKQMRRRLDDAEIKVLNLDGRLKNKTDKLEPKLSSSSIGIDGEKDNGNLLDKLDSKKKQIDEKNVEIKNLKERLDFKKLLLEEKNCEIKEKDRHIQKLTQVKDELFKNKEALKREKDDIKTLAKGISKDSDTLVSQILQKDELIRSLRKHLVDELGEDSKESKNNFDTSKENYNRLRMSSPELNVIDNKKPSLTEEIDVLYTEENNKNKLVIDDDNCEAIGSDSDSYSSDDSEEGKQEQSHQYSTNLPDTLFETPSDELDYELDEDIEILEENPHKKETANKDTKPTYPFRTQPLEDEFPMDSYAKTTERLGGVEKVPCTNLRKKDDKDRTLLITLDTFVEYFQPRMTIRQVGIILEELEIPLYMSTKDRVTESSPLVHWRHIESSKEEIESLCSNFA